MKVKQLRNVMDRFADLTGGDRSTKEGKSIRNFADALGEFDTKTVKAFVKETKKRQNQIIGEQKD